MRKRFVLALLALVPVVVWGKSVVPPDTVAVPAGKFVYQDVGEYTDRGLPMNPPRVEGELPDGVRIMHRQVSQAEYARCVQEGKCKRLDKGFRQLEDPGLPAIGISWNDATDYAKWLSAKTGQKWRLPSYQEWVRAAAERYQEEGFLPSDPDNPAVRWLAEYRRETSRRQGRIKQAMPFGHFGTNTIGVQDMAGNVWEWTNGCFTRYSMGSLPLQPRENCGIRVLAGAHAAAMPDFIRDPRAGACSIGLPPTNLGFRLVLEDS